MPGTAVATSRHSPNSPSGSSIRKLNSGILGNYSALVSGNPANGSEFPIPRRACRCGTTGCRRSVTKWRSWHTWFSSGRSSTIRSLTLHSVIAGIAQLHGIDEQILPNGFLALILFSTSGLTSHIPVHMGSTEGWRVGLCRAWSARKSNGWIFPDAYRPPRITPSILFQNVQGKAGGPHASQGLDRAHTGLLSTYSLHIHQFDSGSLTKPWRACSLQTATHSRTSFAAILMWS